MAKSRLESYLDKFTYLMTREDQGVGDDNVLPAARREDNDFGNVVRGKRFAATSQNVSARSRDDWSPS